MSRQYKFHHKKGLYFGSFVVVYRIVAHARPRAPARVAGMVGARSLQKKQWGNIMRQVYQAMGKPKIQMATSQVVEFDYNDRTNTIGRAEYGEIEDQTKQVKNE